MTAEFLHEMAALPRSPWPPLPPSVGPPAPCLRLTFLFRSGEYRHAPLSDMGTQNVIRISPASSSTPKSNRTLGHRSSQLLGCGIAGPGSFVLMRVEVDGKIPAVS